MFSKYAKCISAGCRFPEVLVGNDMLGYVDAGFHEDMKRSFDKSASPFSVLRRSQVMSSAVFRSARFALMSFKVRSSKMTLTIALLVKGFSCQPAMQVEEILVAFSPNYLKTLAFDRVTFENRAACAAHLVLKEGDLDLDHKSDFRVHVR